MGKKSRRQRGDKRAHLNPTERSLKQLLDTYEKEDEEEEAMNNEPTPGICAATHERRRRRAVIAAAEAECRAAVPSNPPTNHKVSPASHPRLYRAIMALVDAVSLDEDDKEAMGEYLRKSVGNRPFPGPFWDAKALKNPPPTPGLNSSLKKHTSNPKINLKCKSGDFELKLKFH